MINSIMSSKPLIAKKLDGITLTLGDMAENHVGMEQIGKMVEAGQGFQLEDLQYIQNRMEARGVVCELVTLSSADQPAAYVLILRKGVDALLDGKTQLSMFTEQKCLSYDKQAFMYGRVVNKHARWNLCFDEKSREPDYEAGKGRIVGYNEVPIMHSLMNQVETLFGPKAAGLKVESNYYYDTTKCGIGFHGDSERRKVVGVRIGHASTPMNWQWFYQGKPVGDRIIIPLEPGDMYVMSEKAVGTDWKKKTILTLRHATGCDKFTTLS
jgi:hypothetical protein